MNVRHQTQIRMIPVQQLVVLNPRERGKKKFDGWGRSGRKRGAERRLW